MTRVQLRRTAAGEWHGFQVSGHADYAAYGADIVCAAISVLTISTVNGLEAQGIPLKAEQRKDGHVDVTLAGNLSREDTLRATAILDTFALGMDGIAQTYGSSYLEIQQQTL